MLSSDNKQSVRQSTSQESKRYHWMAHSALTEWYTAHSLNDTQRTHWMVHSALTEWHTAHSLDWCTCAANWAAKSRLWGRMRPASASRSTHQIDHSVRQPNVILAAGAQRCGKLGCRPYLIYAEIRLGLTPCLNLLFSQSVRAPQTLFASQAAKISERAGGRMRFSQDGASVNRHSVWATDLPRTWPQGATIADRLALHSSQPSSSVGVIKKKYQKLNFFVCYPIFEAHTTKKSRVY